MPVHRILKIKFIKLTFLLFFLLSNSVFSQQYWQKIGSPTGADLKKCSFVDTLNGWAVGDSGVILHTTNGGYNWVLQDSKIKRKIETVFFLNQRLGWAVAFGNDPEYYGSYILRTTNGGNVWDTSRFIIPDSYVRVIYFQDSLFGFIGGNPNVLMRTTDAGANWTRCNIDSSAVAGFPIHKFRFFSQNYGIACGGIMDIAGVVWTTTNRGEFWSVKPISAEPINDIRFFDSVNMIAIAGDYEYGTSLLRTTNAGVNWDYSNIGVFGIPGCMAFRTSNEAWCPMGWSPILLFTSNSGYNWQMYESPDSSKLMDLAFVNNKFGIAVGIGGAVIRYNQNITFTVSGTARYSDNNQPLTSGKVKAFKLNKQTGGVIYVDSAAVQPDGTYSLTHVPQDSVDIGVFPNSTPPNDWVITYYPSTINWQSATIIYPSGNLSNIDINVFRLVTTTANNSVNGKVMQGASMNLAGLKDVFVYVKNGNTFVRSGITDSLGVYHMQSLPSGNLKVIVNRIGYSGDSTNVTVTSTSNIDSVNFYLNRISVGVNQTGTLIPSEYKLYQNYPNPFNPATIIKFQIIKSEFVTLKIFDILGREVASLVNEKLRAGVYEFSFNAASLPSGLYFCNMKAGEFSETKKLVLIK